MKDEKYRNWFLPPMGLQSAWADKMQTGPKLPQKTRQSVNIRRASSAKNLPSKIELNGL